MPYVAPHYGNLKARAAKLGLVITKTTTTEDARIYGGHNYVLHAPGDDWDNMEMLALGGIRHEIELAEKANLERAATTAVAAAKRERAELEASRTPAAAPVAAALPYSVKPRGYSARAHELFSTLYRLRAEGERGAAMSHLARARIALDRKWNGRDHDGLFFGLYYVNEAGERELCEVDGGVCYEAHRDRDDAEMMLAADKTLSASGSYEVHPIPGGQRVADPITESVVTAKPHMIVTPPVRLTFPAADRDSAIIDDAAKECAAIAERDILPIAKSRYTPAQLETMYRQAGKLPSFEDMLSIDDECDRDERQRAALLTIAGLLDDWPTMRALSAVGAEKATANKEAARRAINDALGRINYLPEPKALELLPLTFNVELGDGYPHPYPNHLPEAEQEAINENAACHRLTLQGVRSFEWRFTLTMEFSDRAAYEAAQTATGWKAWNEGRFILEAVTDAGAGREHPAIIVGDRAYNQLFIRFA
jgi:hypothetical protein